MIQMMETGRGLRGEARQLIRFDLRPEKKSEIQLVPGRPVIGHAPWKSRFRIQSDECLRS